GPARMFWTILTAQGEAAAAIRRNVLIRALAQAADSGFTFYTHPEIEFYLFQAIEQAGDPLIPVDNAGYFDHVACGQGHDFRRAAITLLESMRSEERRVGQEGRSIRLH